VRVRERTALLTQEQLDVVRQPRTVTLEEARDGELSFVAVDNSREYRRTLRVEPRADGRFRVDQRVELGGDADAGMWDVLFATLLVAHLARVGPDTKPPFWFPPDKLDGQATAALSRIATLGFVLGYTTILLGQTITYAAQEFGANKAAQGVALASVRLDVVIALPLAFLADRKGRKWLAVNGTIAACLCSALGALAPNLVGLTATQVLARGATNACIAVTAVMLAEEMPAGARAWATSLATMAGGLGGGICIAALGIADFRPGAWRVLYVIPLLFVPLVRSVGRTLQETKRFVVHSQNKVTTRRSWQVLLAHRGRFALLASSTLLFALFATPAAQFQNEFLRNDRGFSGAQISLFVTVTSIPGVVGFFVGGRLAESGRRAVGAAATFFGVGLTVLQFWSYGLFIYLWSTIATVFGAAAVPALGVYGPELFPTEARSAANGGIGLASRLGGVVGLLVAGELGDRVGLTRAFTYLSVGPLLLTILILVAYPETAHHTLEDLNPEDKPI
jgi:MFS family permease